MNKIIIICALSICGFTENCNEALISKIQAYRHRQKLLHNTQGYLAAGEILRKINTFSFTEEQFQQWFQTAFLDSRRDIYFRYPNIDPKTLDDLCAFANIKKRPLPTHIDIKHSEFMRWRKTLAPFSVASHLASELEKIFFQEGSRGNFKIIQNKIRSYLDAENYSKKTLTALSQIADMEGYQNLKKRLHHLRIWQNQLNTNPHTQLFELSLHMASEMEAILLYGGGSDDFDAFMLSSFGGAQTPYFQYPGITQPELEKLFISAGLPKPVGPAPMDLIKQEAIKAFAKYEDTSDKELFKALLKEIENIESKGTLSNLQEWYDTTYGQTDRDIYSQHPGISSQAVQNLEHILQIKLMQ